ncbi:MAG TPA: aminoglycoside phosphotransferase family protein [Streptosporangiaceae bacterium]
MRELLAWAVGALAGVGRPVTGAVEQVRTWNLSGVFRFPTAGGYAWLKAVPGFAADEAAVIGAFAGVAPGLVPRVLAAAPGRVLAAGPGRVLMDEVPGRDCWEASAEVITGAVTRLVEAQAALAHGAPAGVADRRGSVLAGRVRALLDREDGARPGDGAGVRPGGLSAREVERARGLAGRWGALDGCGLPGTVVHGDFHPGNWRSDGGAPVVLDFADAHLGDPVLDGLRMGHFLTGRRLEVARRAWAMAWRDAVPGCAPERALEVGAPLAHLAYAARYQEFLDGIEPSERVYHEGDPAAEIRAALRAAAPA